MAAESDNPTPNEEDVLITRVFDAPREMVFRAWIDPAQMGQWWGPNGFTNPVCELDARPGGEIHIHMRAPNGVVYPMKGMFHEIVEPERLSFSSGALDENGKPLFDLLQTVTFTEQDGKTTLTVRRRVVEASADAARYLKGYKAGMIQSLERLAALVSPGRTPP